MRVLKVGLVLDDSLDKNDGVQQYVRTLGDWLSSQGHTVHYLVGQSQSDGKTVHSLSRNVDVRFNKNRLSIPLPANNASINKLLATEQYDVLHVQMPYSPFMAGKVINATPATTAVIGTFHILPFGRLQQTASKALAIVQKRSLNRFDAICSVSPAAAAFAKGHFGVGSQVIPNMVALKQFKSMLKPHPGRIVFLGRLVPRKGVQQLLQALRYLPADILSKIEVLIAGDGPERPKLEKFARSHNLASVVFLGRLPETGKASLLASAELAVFPALGGESFGIVLIEAMAAGAGAVLGGNNPGYNSVLGQWPEVLIDPNNTAAFAKQLEFFLTKKSLRTRIHKAQQKAVKQYDTSVVGQQILQLYEAGLLHRRQDVQ